MTHLQANPPAIDWDAQVSIKLLSESAPIALAIVNGDGQILYVNAKLEEMFGYRREELVGKAVEVLMPERFHRKHVQYRHGYVRQPHERIMGSGMDLAGRRKDGSEFPLEAGLSHLNVANDLVIIATITDVSRRKQTEELLEQRVEERTRELERRQRVSDGLRDIVALLNSNHPLEEVLDHIGLRAMELLGAQATILYQLQEGDRQLVMRACLGFLATKQSQGPIPLNEESAAGVAILQRRPIALPDLGRTSQKDEPEVKARRQWLLAHGCRALLAVPLYSEEDVCGSLVLYYQQVHEFDAEQIGLAQTLGSQAALAIENSRLRIRIEQTAVAAERNRIARDLHDSVTQTLFSASMIAEVLPHIWQRNPGEGERRLGELHELTRGALAEMRTLLLELRPAKLIEVEMADLLRQLAEAVAGRARVAVAVQIEGEAVLPVDVKIALYRIAQEALNNVAKHAHATRATVYLRRLANSAELIVHDDGIGFVFDRIRPEHLGLGIMRERADAIGATLTVQSLPQQGTTVTARWTRRSKRSSPD
jgi:PAS domain S-box-containing protein